MLFRSAELAETLIGEMEAMPDDVDETPATDPRWDGLKKLSAELPDGDS